MGLRVTVSKASGRVGPQVIHSLRNGPKLPQDTTLEKACGETKRQVPVRCVLSCVSGRISSGRSKQALAKFSGEIERTARAISSQAWHMSHGFGPCPVAVAAIRCKRALTRDTQGVKEGGGKSILVGRGARQDDRQCSYTGATHDAIMSPDHSMYLHEESSAPYEA